MVLLLVRRHSVSLLSVGPPNYVDSPSSFVALRRELMGQTIVYIVISAVICVAYFTLVDHFLMDMQGLDYWYLFRK